MSRRATIGLELSSEAVRGVALTLGRRKRLLSWAEREISSLAEIPAALSEVLAELAATGPSRLIVFGAKAKLIHLTLPKMGAREFRGAIAIQGAEQLDDMPEAYLTAHSAFPAKPDGSREISLIYLPREPLETWSSLLAAQGCPVEGVVTPGSIVAGHLRERDPGEATGLLWASIGGNHTGLALVKGREISLSREIRCRPIAADDPVAAVEKRLEDFREIERSLLYFRQNVDRRGISRIVLCGASEEVLPLYEQLQPPLKELGIEIEQVDPWSGVDLGDLADPAAESRLTAALQAALPRQSALAIVPGSTLNLRRQQRRRRLALAASAAFAAVGVGVAGLTLQRLDALTLTREAAATRLNGIALPQGSTQQDTPAELIVRPHPAADWSGLLTEAGLLARPGVDYKRLVLTITDEGPLLGLEGEVTSGQTQQTGLLLAALHAGVMQSAYGMSLPRLAAESGDEESRSEHVRFAIEGAVTSRANAGGEQQ